MRLALLPDSHSAEWTARRVPRGSPRTLTWSLARCRRWAAWRFSHAERVMTDAGLPALPATVGRLHMDGTTVTCRWISPTPAAARAGIRLLRRALAGSHEQWDALENSDRALADVIEARGVPALTARGWLLPQRSSFADDVASIAGCGQAGPGHECTATPILPLAWWDGPASWSPEHEL